MGTAMADGKATETAAAMVNSNGQRQWPMATVMGKGNGDGDGVGNNNGDGNGVGNNNGDGDGDHNRDGHSEGNDDKGRVASSCAGNVQQYGRGDTLPPPPWTQRKVHSPVLRNGGDTAKSVSSLSRGRVPDSSPWNLFFYLQLLFSLLNNPLFAPRIIQVLKNPVSLLALYLLYSTKNPVSLLTIYPGSYCNFCQGKPRQGLQ
jgi:hypothetical protein